MKKVWLVAFKEGEALVIYPVEAGTDDEAVEIVTAAIGDNNCDREWAGTWFVCDKNGDSVGEMIVKGLSVGLRIAEKVSWLL